MEMNKPNEAMDHFQKSLEIQQQLSGDPQKDRSLLVTLHCIGCCLMEMDKPNKAMDHFKNHLKSNNNYQMIHRTTKICHLLCMKRANA